MNRNLMIAAAVGAVAVGTLALMSGEDNVLPPVASPLSTPAVAQEAAAATTTEEQVAAFRDKGYAVGDIVLGDPDAPVTIIEYARLTCPACGAFHQQTLPQLKEKYINDGKAKLIIREVFADARGLLAASIARCAGPDSYHDFMDVFFQRQPDWIRASNMEDLRAKITPIGRLGGLSAERMEQCMTDEPFLQYMLETTSAAADADNITRTPTLIINGVEFEGAYHDIDGLSAAIDAQLQ